MNHYFPFYGMLPGFVPHAIFTILRENFANIISFIRKDRREDNVLQNAHLFVIVCVFVLNVDTFKYMGGRQVVASEQSCSLFYYGKGVSAESGVSSCRRVYGWCLSPVTFCPLNPGGPATP